MKIDQITEGYTVLPPMSDEDKLRYGDREAEGLEGPFRMRNGKVVYYDKRAGKYYDPDTDMFISDEDYFAMDSYKSRAEESVGINEEWYDAYRDYKGMGYSDAQARAEADRAYPQPKAQPKPQRKPQRKPELIAMHFFNVPAADEDTARMMGLKQTKSGKWYVGEYTTSKPSNLQAKLDAAARMFGEPKRWEPKKKANEGELDEAIHGWAARAVGGMIFRKGYKKAVEMLRKEIEKDNGPKHSVEYYASELLRRLRGGDMLDTKELAAMYKKQYAAEDQQIDPKLAMGAKQAATRMGAKGSGSRMATAMDKVSQGQAVTGQLSKEIAPFMDQLEKILANPQLRQKFMMLVKQAEQVQEAACPACAGRGHKPASGGMDRPCDVCDGTGKQQIEEAPGDIRKGIAAIALIAGLWGVNNHLAQQAYDASPQLQKLTAYLEVAQEHNDQRMIKQLEQRIENHKARLDIGKGDVMGKDGRPIDVKYDKDLDESTDFRKDDRVKDARTGEKGTVLHKGNRDEVVVKFGSLNKSLPASQLRLVDEGEQHGNSKVYDKCWDGYKKVPGKKRGEKGSCVKK